MCYAPPRSTRSSQTRPAAFNLTKNMPAFLFTASSFDDHLEISEGGRASTSMLTPMRLRKRKQPATVLANTIDGHGYALDDTRLVREAELQGPKRLLKGEGRTRSVMVSGRWKVEARCRELTRLTIDEQQSAGTELTGAADAIALGRLFRHSRSHPNFNDRHTRPVGQGDEPHRDPHRRAKRTSCRER